MRNPAEAGWRRLDVVLSFLAAAVLAAMPFIAGHIPGAVNLEFHPGDKLEFSREKRARLKELIGPDKDRPVVIYCRSFR